MLDKIATSVDKFLDLMTSSFGKKYITDYIDMETVNDRNTLVSKDGSLITIIKIRGNLNLYDPEEYSNLTHILESRLSSMFVSPEHKMQIFFEYDHDNTKKELQDVMYEARITNKRLNLNLDDVLNERENNLLEYVCSEKFYIALWTTTAGISKEQAKNQKEKRQEFLKTQALPITSFGQDPLRASTEIQEKHSSFVTNFRSSLSDVRISCDIVDSRSALREMRKCFDKSFTEETWSPFIPGDTILPSVKESNHSIDSYDIMYPKISHQICPSPAILIDNDVVEMGERVYSSLFFELFPQNIYPFQNLFIAARNQGIPWRYSLLISGGGLSSSIQMKGMISHLLAFSNGGNKLIKQDIGNLKEYKGSIVEVRATFTTWAPKNNVKLLKTRYENLKNVLGGWGNPEVSKTTGDPVAAIASSSLAATQGNIGTKSAAPFNQILLMSPFSRPCSMWENGSVILRSPDGKILPYEPFSSKQTTWVEIITGKPGSGKSVLMCVFNLALCFNPNISKLPRIAIIDIGPSSAGFISLLKEGLPDNLKHLVISHKLRNLREESVNILDTPLGSREPLAMDMSFLMNFISIIATDPVVEKLPEGMSGLINKVLTEVYYIKSESGNPNEYNPNFAYSVDKALSDLEHEKGIVLEKIKEARLEGIQPTILWWDIVDFLFINGYEKEAKIAQRYAVPKIIDLIDAANSERIKSEYSPSEISSFTRNIKDACAFYPVLTDITKLDMDLARIISVDLDDVAKAGGGAIADRMTTVMYMLTRFLLAKDFYINEDIADQTPISVSSRIELSENVPIELYKEYHYKRGANMKKEQKRLVYDEFHRVSTTKSAEYIVAQVIDEIRVGRKYQVDIMLGSQSLTDFDKTLLSFTTGVFVLDGGNEQVIQNVGELLGMRGPVIENIMQHQIKSPRKGGGVFLAKFDTIDGPFVALASATLGPLEIWAFTTTAADSYVRNGLYKVMKPSEARLLLAQHYRNGSIKSEVEKLMEEKQKNKINENMGVQAMSQKDEEDIYGQILFKLVDLAEKEGYEVNRNKMIV